MIVDVKGILSSGNHQGMTAIGLSEARLPQVQLLKELARLRKGGADIVKFLCRDHKSSERKGTEEACVG